MLIRVFLCSVAVAVGSWLGGASPAHAATFVVNSADDDLGLNPGNGTCETAPGNGICTLRRAIHEAHVLLDTPAPAPSVIVVLQVPGGLVTLAAGSEPLGWDAYSPVASGAGSLTIVGAGPATTIVDGNRTLRTGPVFTFCCDGGRSVTIAGLTIRNGSAGVEGVGLLTLTNVHLRDHVGGGGLLWTGERVLVDNSVVTANSSVGTRGGGITMSAADPDVLRIRRSTISFNSAAQGGGIVSNTPIEMVDSVLHDNTASGMGGGAMIAHPAAQSRIVNSTISGNQSNASGAGMAVMSGSVQIFNGTITNNQADANLDGVGTAGGVLVEPTASLTFTNTILAGNRKSIFQLGVWTPIAGDCTGTVTSGGFNLMGTNDCIVIGPAPTVGDPQLAPLADTGGRTVAHGLLAGGPAIDAGDPAGCSDGLGGVLTRDQRDFIRAGLCDIGAFERGAVASTKAKPRDVNGDGRGDLVWRKGDTGQNAMWLMTGGTIDTALFLPTVADPGWRLVGSDDFDGDGKADLLWVHAVTGQPAVWLLNGATVRSAGLLPKPEPGWQLAAVGDFDGDRRADIVWQAAGQRVLWLMDGIGLQAVRPLPLAGAWTIVGAGDIDGDSRTDLIWRLPATGGMAAWRMDGTTILASTLLPTVNEAGWGVSAVVDLSGDGRADMLWRNHLTGELAAWLLSGFVLLDAQMLPTVPLVWQLAPPSDTDGDGTADLLWRHSVTGQNALWQMSGVTVDAGLLLTTVPQAAWEMR
jgi:CSLREA domain-containing protein